VDEMDYLPSHKEMSIDPEKMKGVEKRSLES
jgi:hypothetical protein